LTLIENILSKRKLTNFVNLNSLRVANYAYKFFPYKRQSLGLGHNLIKPAATPGVQILKSAFSALQIMRLFTTEGQRRDVKEKALQRIKRCRRKAQSSRKRALALPLLSIHLIAAL
jgi:hypothetical protein